MSKWLVPDKERQSFCLQYVIKLWSTLPQDVVDKQADKFTKQMLTRDFCILHVQLPDQEIFNPWIAGWQESALGKYYTLSTKLGSSTLA